MTVRPTIMAVLACLLLLVSTPANAQHAEHAIYEVVETLFEGMRTGNADLVASVFADGAELVSSGERNGQPFAQRSTAAGFIEAVGRPSDAPWDERIWNVDITIQNNLATAWMDYAFFFGDRLSHCGSNTFQLARQSDGAWKTVALADTRVPPAACDLNADEVEETMVRNAVRHYLKGHATGDGAHHALAMAEDVGSMYFVDDEGALQSRTFEAYIAGAPGSPADNEAERVRYIDWVDISGTTAVARVVLDNPGMVLIDYMSLLKIDGEWQIVNKIFDRQAK